MHSTSVVASRVLQSSANMAGIFEVDGKQLRLVHNVDDIAYFTREQHIRLVSSTLKYTLVSFLQHFMRASGHAPVT